MPQNAIENDKPSVSAEEVWLEIESISSSPGFVRSERLQRFLRFICDLTLKGESHRINEYLIGSEVFRRGGNYNPTEDSIVRRQAHALRQKLQDFYGGEGGDHLVRVELPVGRYVPVFRRCMPTTEQDPEKTAVAPQMDPEPAIAPLGTAAASTFRAVQFAWVAAAGLAILVAGWALGRLTTSQSPSQPSGAAREIWAPWTQGSQEAVVCFSNPLTAVLKHFEEPVPADASPKRFKVPLSEEAVFRETFKLEPGGHLYFSPVTNQTKMGEAFAAAYLGAFLGRSGVRITPIQSRFMTWDQLRRQNVIVLGHTEANHWVEPLLAKYPFRLTATSGRQQRAIVNTAPRPGEPSEYQINYSDAVYEADQEYALVSMLPGVGEALELMIISGLNTQATQIASEYMTSEATLAILLSKLRAEDPGHSGPWHFQAVLKTEVHDKVPTRASLVALHVLR